jgi:small-conductance mechanosensitive channel
MDFSNEIAILEQERQAAVVTLDFARAREITTHIKKLRKTTHQFNTKTHKLTANSKFESERDRAIVDFRLQSTEFTRQLYQLRSIHQSELAKVRKSHATQLKDLAESLAKDLEICSTRSIPRVNRLKREAHLEGIAEHYDQADLLLKEAEAHREEVIKERQSVLHELYTEKQRTLVAKHEEFEKSFESKLEDDMTQLKLQFRRELAASKRRITSQAIRFGVEISEPEIVALFEPYALKDAEEPEPPPPNRTKTVVSSWLFNPKFPLREEKPRPATRAREK